MPAAPRAPPNTVHSPFSAGSPLSPFPSPPRRRARRCLALLSLARRRPPLLPAPAGVLRLGSCPSVGAASCLSLPSFTCSGWLLHTHPPPLTTTMKCTACLGARSYRHVTLSPLRHHPWVAYTLAAIALAPSSSPKSARPCTPWPLHMVHHNARRRTAPGCRPLLQPAIHARRLSLSLHYSARTCCPLRPR